MYGAGRSRITHPFATLTTKQSLMDPVRLACVKHAASVRPSQDQTLNKMVSKQLSLFKPLSSYLS